MARGLTANMQAEVVKGAVQPVLFVEIGVATAIIRVWSGVGSISWNGQTWTGVGQFGSIEPITETTAARAVGLKLVLSGIKADLLSYALTEIRHGKDATVWLGFMDPAGAIIADPYKSFAGKVDTADIEKGGETGTIQVSVESRKIEQKVARTRRWTTEDQKLDYSSDLGFEYVASLQDKQIIWGRGTPLPSSAGKESPYPVPTDGGPPGGYYGSGGY